MTSYAIKHYLPAGNPTREWTARTYGRILRCKEQSDNADGQVKKQLESEISVLNRALAACDITPEQAEKEYGIYRKTRSMCLQAGAEAAKKAMDEF